MLGQIKYQAETGSEAETVKSRKRNEHISDSDGV